MALAAGGIAREGARAASTVVAAGAQGAAREHASFTRQVSAYSVDTLFRAAPSSGNTAPTAAAPSSPAETRAEVTRILATALGKEGLTDADKAYLVQLVASRTGLSTAEAEQRVDAVVAQVKAAELKARQAADQARKVASITSIFTALSMLIGAFIACVAAAIGDASATFIHEARVMRTPGRRRLRGTRRITLHFEALQSHHSITVGPAEAFRVGGNFLRRLPGNEVLGEYSRHQWHVQGGHFSRYDCLESCVVYFADREADEIRSVRSVVSRWYVLDGTMDTPPASCSPSSATRRCSGIPLRWRTTGRIS